MNIHVGITCVIHLNSLNGSLIKCVGTGISDSVSLLFLETGEGLVRKILKSSNDISLVEYIFPLLV